MRLTGNHPMRIVSIDPGTNHLGMACLKVHDGWTQLSVEDAYTVEVAGLAKRKQAFNVELFGERYAKLMAIKDAVLKYLLAWQPLIVCVESPYMGRFPAAFSALTECITAIQRAVYEYDPCCVIRMVEPSRVKTSVGVSGKSGDKDAVRMGLLKRNDIQVQPIIHDLDEHGVDAIAVGYAYASPSLITET